MPDDMKVVIEKTESGRERLVIRDSCGIILDVELPSEEEIDAMLDQLE